MDLLIINGVLFFVSDKEFLNIYFSSYVSVFWIIISLFSNYYKIYRFTKIYRILSLLFLQFFLFVLVYFSYFGIFREGDVVHNQFLILASILSGLTLFKFLSYYGLKLYRKEGKNYRNVVIIGQDDTSNTVAKFFLNKADLGYKYHGFFTDETPSNGYCLGTLKDSFEYILRNSIDEIYCTISALNKDEVKEFTKFANTHSRVIKLIPNSNELYSKNLNAEFYNNTLVLNVKKLPLDIAENRVFKRTFDIAFSLFIIIFFMSWLAPILWIFIKLESRGPALFKQDREGLGGYHFTCYKFRSMNQNSVSDLIHAKINDNRVTTVGSFMRKTSLDELPQFFNVLLGDMSVVQLGPELQAWHK
jgi:putative colanic acid biosynthesis UDP-glucose lipid carrier transferase